MSAKSLASPLENGKSQDRLPEVKSYELRSEVFMVACIGRFVRRKLMGPPPYTLRFGLALIPMVNPHLRLITLQQLRHIIHQSCGLGSSSEAR